MHKPTSRFDKILVTGGAGFIGSNFIHFLFQKADFIGTVVNLDKLTYAGNLMSLTAIEKEHGGSRYYFEKGDICDYERVKNIIGRYDIDAVIHFAAESHVDRSIYSPKDFIETNVTGTFRLLEACRKSWGERTDVRFHHVSTDEVYGSLEGKGQFNESTPYSPRSPYSASKAASDHLVRAYFHTYALSVTISNCSNNYGPYQFPEKLIPLMILNAFEGKALPVYGDGKNIRDWLFVEDHCSAIWAIVNRGRAGETYNVGGECEKENLEVVHAICTLLQELQPASKNPALNGKSYKDLITFVKDRPGHDRRYAINCDKLKLELGWEHEYDFASALKHTVLWYLNNMAWVNKVKSGEYLKWYEEKYSSG